MTAQKVLPPGRKMVDEGGADQGGGEGGNANLIKSMYCVYLLGGKASLEVLAVTQYIYPGFC